MCYYLFEQLTAPTAPAPAVHTEEAAGTSNSTRPITGPSTSIPLASADTSAKERNDAPATEPTQPSSAQPAASQAMLDVQKTNTAASDKPRSKKDRSPPGKNDDVILLSSEHGSSSAGESSDDGDTAAEPRRIKTEPFSMNDVDSATGGTETTNSAPSVLPTSTQRTTAPNQAETQSEQSADSDADDEGSVGGNDPDPSSTDG